MRKKWSFKANIYIILLIKADAHNFSTAAAAAAAVADSFFFYCLMKK